MAVGKDSADVVRRDGRLRIVFLSLQQRVFVTVITVESLGGGDPYVTRPVLADVPDLETRNAGGREELDLGADRRRGCQTNKKQGEK